MTKTERAWAAGFFDGEGSVRCYRRSDGSGFRIRCTITQAQRRTLLRFKHAVGVGTIRGPYPHGKWKPLFVWEEDKTGSIELVYTCLRPYLDQSKKNDFRVALAAMRQYRKGTHERRVRAGYVSWKKRRSHA